MGAAVLLIMHFNIIRRQPKTLLRNTDEMCSTHYSSFENAIYRSARYLQISKKLSIRPVRLIW